MRLCNRYTRLRAQIAREISRIIEKHVTDIVMLHIDERSDDYEKFRSPSCTIEASRFVYFHRVVVKVAFRLPRRPAVVDSAQQKKLFCLKPS